MKVLVDIPEELYDTLRNKTLNLTSDARSNGKHLVYELIGCIMNGTVVEEKQSDRELFESICEKYGVKKDNEEKGLRIIMENGEVKPLTEELLHEIFPFDVPFVTGLSADSADVPECETWSNNEEPIEIKYGEKNLVDFTKLEYNEKYPFIDDDGRHYRVSYTHTKIYADEEKPVYFSSNTNGLTRDCASCKHYKDYKDVNTGRVIRGCESWECNYEMR